MVIYTFINNDIPNLANTYSAIGLLKMLGDDLSRLHSERILESLKYFQKEDGRIMALPLESEDDVRFAYGAAAIYKILSHHLDDKSEPSFDTQKLVDFYKQGLSYDGGFSWSPYGESHAGLTYGLLGGFKILGREYEFDNDRDQIIEWLVSRQCLTADGFQGRINKIPDTGYSYWNTASLAILEPDNFKDFIHKESVIEFINEGKRYGGYAKLIFSDYPDIVHTFYSLAFMSLVNEEGLNEFDPILAIPGTIAYAPII